jgi:hypothetical protein
MPSDHYGPSQIPTNITCPKCKAVGVVVWEKIKGERVLVGVSNNFYERLSKNAPYEIELVCLGCGTEQLEN